MCVLNVSMFHLVSAQCVSTELLTLIELLTEVESNAGPELLTEALVCVASLKDCLHKAQLVLCSPGTLFTEQLSLTSPHQVRSTHTTEWTCQSCSPSEITGIMCQVLVKKY